MTKSIFYEKNNQVIKMRISAAKIKISLILLFSVFVAAILNTGMVIVYGKMDNWGVTLLMISVLWWLIFAILISSGIYIFITRINISFLYYSKKNQKQITLSNLLGFIFSKQIEETILEMEK